MEPAVTALFDEGPIRSPILSPIRHAGLALGEPHQETEPFGAAERPKHSGDHIRLRLQRQAHRRTGRMPAMRRASVQRPLTLPRFIDR